MEAVEREPARVVQIDVVGALGLHALVLRVQRRDLLDHLVRLQVRRRERHVAQVAGHRVPRHVQVAEVGLRVVRAEDAVRLERDRQPAHDTSTELSRRGQSRAEHNNTRRDAARPAADRAADPMTRAREHYGSAALDCG